LDDAIDFGEVTYVVSNSVDEMVDNFTVTAKTKATAVSFMGDDLKSVLKQDVAKNVEAGVKIEEESLSMQFGKSDADFEKGTIIIRVNAAAKIKPSIDLENLKKGILGKGEDDLKAHLETYPDVEKVEINYWPSFISGKIPAYESRVDIELDNN